MAQFTLKHEHFEHLFIGIDAQFSLRVIAGKNLCPPDERAACNSYCIIKLRGTEVARTKVESKTADPVWDFAWSTTITDFGTFEHPAIVKLQVYNQGFIRDTFFGQIVLPLIVFADKEDHVLTLPLQDRHGSPQHGQVKLHISLDIDREELPTLSEIDAQYSHLVEKRIIPDSPHPIRPAEKWQAIANAKAERKKKLSRPQFYVEELKNGTINMEAFRSLSQNLHDRVWQSRFVASRGVDWMFFYLEELLLKIKSPVIQHQAKDKAVVSILLICFERLKDRGEVLAQYNYLRVLLECAEHLMVEDVLVLFTILKHLSIQQNIHASAVIAAMRYFIFVFGDTFQSIVTEFYEGTNIIFKPVFLEVINGMLSACDSYEEREDIREQISDFGITVDNLIRLGEGYPDDELIEQITTFKNQFEIDQKLITNGKDAQMIEHLQGELSRTIKNLIDTEKKYQQALRKIQELERVKGDSTDSPPNCDSVHITVPEGPQRRLTPDSQTLGSKLGEASPRPRADSCPPPKIGDSSPRPKDKPTLNFIPDQEFLGCIDKCFVKPVVKTSAPPTPTRGGPPPPPPGTRGGTPRGGPPPPPGKRGGHKGNPAPFKGPLPGVANSPTQNRLGVTFRLTKMNQNPEDTIFGTLGSPNNEAPVAKKLDFDKLTEVFAKKANNEQVSVTPRSFLTRALSVRGEPTLIDPRRSQQLDIFLGRFQFSHEALVQSITTLTLQKGITNELLEIVFSLFVKKDPFEIQAFTNFKGSIDSLTRPELFLRMIYQVPRFSEKIQILISFQAMPQLEQEIEKDVSSIKMALESLQEPFFRTLLSYFTELAEFFSSSVRGFRLSSLRQLSELKSPNDRKVTLLLHLVEQIHRIDPEILSHVADTQKLFNQASISMAGFQASFPVLIFKLCELEGEIQATSSDTQNQEAEGMFLIKLIDFRDSVRKTLATATADLEAIDQKIMFLGDHQNTDPANQTINDIYKTWTKIASMGLLSEVDANQRSKRDEDRYAFFTCMDHFFNDVKNAYLFTLARYEKEKQKEAYLNHIADAEVDHKPKSPLASTKGAQSVKEKRANWNRRHSSRKSFEDVIQRSENREQTK